MVKQYSRRHFFLLVITAVTVLLLFAVVRPVRMEITTEAMMQRRSYFRHNLEIHQRKQEIRELLNSHAGTRALPHAAVVMVYGSTPVFIHHNGPKDHLFEAASLTKSITALAILMLSDQGKLDLDRPVNDYMELYIDDKSGGSDPVTARHLLHHTSGLNNAYVPVTYQGERHTAVQQTVPAGYRVFYSNTGYNVLGDLVEALSGYPLFLYTSQQIVTPMGWNRGSTPSSMRGSMGYRFTISDMAEYLSLLLGEGAHEDVRLISRATFRQIYNEPVEQPRKRNLDYRGICWNIWEAGGDVFSMYHGGLWRRAGGFVQVYPKENVAFAILSDPPDHKDPGFNNFYRSMKYRLMKLASLYFTGEARPEAFRASIPEPEDLPQYQGLYYSPTLRRNIRIDITRGKYLVAYEEGYASSMYLLPMSMLNFVYFEEGNSYSGRAFDFIYSDGKISGLATSTGYFRKIR